MSWISGLFKDWKPLAVLGVLIWSLTTLFQVRSKSAVDDWIYLSKLPPQELSITVQQRMITNPRFKEMNDYAREDLQKSIYDKALNGNTLQKITDFKMPFGSKKVYTVFTNLRLGLDLRGGSQLLLRADPSPLVPEITPEVMRGVETVINNRINSLGVSETIVQRAGRDRLIVEMPGIKDPQQAKDRIGTTAMLEFKELAYTEDGMPVFDEEGKPVWKDVGLTGADFKRAQATPMVGGGTWKVGFEFKPEGAKKFGQLTKRLVGKQIGIFLDGEPTDRGADGRPLPFREYRGVN
ncbi:MAG TPA: hypothetical protein PKD05_24400, partial [Candidatus Melainabacteria bacterium]|nr:hypothetical protein [Candidatus Melainabacteria bacterium]